MESRPVSPPNAILELSFRFAVRIVAFTHELESLKKYNLAKQLFRSGTSIGANVQEAQGAESLNDFIHKMKVAYKEAEETMYWLKICEASENYPNPLNLLQDNHELKKILGKILSSSIQKRYSKM